MRTAGGGHRPPGNRLRRHPLLALLAAVALGAAGCSERTSSGPRPAAPPSPASPPASAVGSPSPQPSTLGDFPLDRALAHIRVLAAEIGVRTAGSPAEERAREHLASTFGALGYEVDLDPVRLPGGGMSRNVVARPRGLDPARPVIVVGGHFDTVAGSPGANDNASGTAVVVALAEAFAGRPVPVLFAAFTAEERQPPTGAHHLGSEELLEGLRNAGTPVAAMLSIDMIANGPALIVGRHRASPDALQTEIAGVAADLAIPEQTIVRGDVSDHVPFALAGVPAAWLWTGEHPSFHLPSDTLDVVQGDAVARAGRTAQEWIRRRVGA
ncbi:MAG: M28 family metallopeptidase [Actinomycetota bacterium]